MRIIHLVYGMGLGGIEQSTAKLAIDHKNKGCEVVVVCLYKNGFIGRQLQLKDIEVIELNLKKGRGLFNLIWPFYEIAKKRKVDVLFVHTTGVDIPIAICTLLYKFKKRFLTVRTIDQNKGLKKIKARIEALISNLVYNKIIAVSHAVATNEEKIIGRYGCLLQVIWNGFDIVKFYPKLLPKSRNEYLGFDNPVSDDMFVVGMGVQLKEFKDIPTAIRAAKRINEQVNKKIIFVIAGEGPLEQELKAQIHTMGVETIFKFVGAIADMPTFLNAIDMLLLTSPFEGFPGIVVEAMLCGKPIISTDCGGIRDSVIDGQTGFIVPVGDDKAIAQGILKLAGDKELAKRMGWTGLVRARQNFTVEKYTQAYWDLITKQK